MTALAVVRDHDQVEPLEAALADWTARMYAAGFTPATVRICVQTVETLARTGVDPLTAVTPQLIGWLSNPERPATRQTY